MRNLLLLVLVLAVHSLMAHERDFAFGKISAAEQALTVYDKDSTASAVVLNEFGTSRIGYRFDLTLRFEYHVRIKILNDQALDQAKVSIPLRRSDNNRFETLSDLEAATYYIDADGGLREAKLDKKQVFKRNKSAYFDEVSFAMPNVKAGSIIEYQYIIESPFIFSFRTWEFQSEIPKMASEYVAVIPAKYKYNVILRGFLKLHTSGQGSLLRDGFEMNGFKCDCSEMIYGMRDIPAFRMEENMTAPSNFMSAIYFQLSEYYDANRLAHAVTKDWPAVDTEMRGDSNFGYELKRQEVFKEALATVVKDLSDPLLKARAIYAFFQKWYKWNDYYGVFSQSGVKKAFANHSGNVADINLGLVAALNACGLSADAVMLSTRENGFVNAIYPNITEFNYVVAKVNIDGKDHLLDATEPLLPFGLLPLRCINGQGRVMPLKKPSYWVDLVASQPSITLITFLLELSSEGKLTGSLVKRYTGYAAYNERKAMKKFNSDEEYFESIADKMVNIKVLEASVNDKDSTEKSLVHLYKVELKGYEPNSLKKVRINPFMAARVTENPFRLKEREFPVDMGAPSEVKMVLTLKLPAEYEIESNPQVLNVALPDNGGKYQTVITHENDLLAFMQLQKFNRSIYSPSEYIYIKELYNKIVESHKSDIVIKRRTNTQSVAVTNAQ